MKLLVCVKSIPDLDMVVASDWKSGDNLSLPDVGYANRIMNYYDENALELALRLKDSSRNAAHDVEIHVLAIGDDTSKKALKDAYAAGADLCTLVRSEWDFRDNAQAAAGVIQKYIESTGDYDIVLCGACAVPYENGQTPFALAQNLDVPCLTDIQKMTMDDGGVKLVCRCGGCELVLVAKTNFVGVVGNIKGVRLRLPTLKKRLESNKKEIVQKTLVGLGVSSEELDAQNGKEQVRLFAEETIKECYFIEDDGCAEHMEIVLDAVKNAMG